MLFSEEGKGLKGRLEKQEDFLQIKHVYFFYDFYFLFFIYFLFLFIYFYFIE